MKLRRSKVVVLTAAFAGILVLSAVVTHASNMGFKLNKTLAASGVFPKGTNLVALPFKNNYVVAEDVCIALGLTAATGRIQQIDAGAASNNVKTHFCGGAGAFTLLQKVGLRITNPTAISGAILVGSHGGGNTNNVSFAGSTGVTFPKGTNDFPVPYHTTAATAEDLCTQFGLTVGTGRIQRIDAAAASNNVKTHFCGNAGPFALVLGESVAITNPTAVGPIAPGHF